jgi:hypothetical protein
LSESWIRAVNAVIRGEAKDYRFIRLGPTPHEFRSLGLIAADIAVSASKVARIRREHPEVTLAILHALPELICDPLVAFPSIRRDGSVVIVLVVRDTAGDPIIAIIHPDQSAGRNVVLSVYGKEKGFSWIQAQIAQALEDGFAVFESLDFAATVPKPGSAPLDAIPSSPGPIPADGTAKPRRDILSLRGKSTKS